MAATHLTLGQFLGHATPPPPRELVSTLQAISLAARLIAHQVQRAGLTDILGDAGAINVQGETVQKLDLFTNRHLIAALEETGQVGVMGSEENKDPILPATPGGSLAVVFDPLDGSSNINVAAPVATVFGILRRENPEAPGDLRDLLQPGTAFLAAGYVLYGSSTLLVTSLGEGVFAFTLDRNLGDFVLQGRQLTHPAESRIYSVNEAYSRHWHPGDRRWLENCKLEGRRTARYIGTLAADFHRNLFKGGIFAYPADTLEASHAAGKLRLLYEAAPLAFLAEQSGGAASDGDRRILEIVPTSLHQRTPLFIGNCADVETILRLRQG